VITLRRGRIPHLTEQQIADITGVTQPRVSQILTAAGDDPVPSPSGFVVARWAVRELRWMAQIAPGPDDAWTAAGDLQRIRSLRKMLKRVSRGIPACPLMRPLSFQERLRIGDTPELRSAEGHNRSDKSGPSPLIHREGGTVPELSPRGEVSYGPGAVLMGRFEDSFQAAPELAAMLGGLCRLDLEILSPAMFIPSPAWRVAQQRFWLGRRVDRTPVDRRTVLKLETLLADVRLGLLPRNLALVGGFYLAETLRTQRLMTDSMLEAGFSDDQIGQTVGLPEGWIDGYRRVFWTAVRSQYTAPVSRSDRRWATLARFFRDLAGAGPWRMARVLTYLQRRREVKFLGFGELQIEGDLSETESLAYEIEWQSAWMDRDLGTQEALEDLRHELSRITRRQVPANDSGSTVAPEAIERSVESILGRPFGLRGQ
jgi:hypothetical protein